MSPAHWVKAERDFLFARTLDRASISASRWIGLSADAMIAAAIAGREPEWSPSDGGDLARCLVTRAVAPPHLHAAMDVLIADWRVKVGVASPAWLRQADRLAEEWTPAVRALVEAESRSTPGRRG